MSIPRVAVIVCALAGLSACQSDRSTRAVTTVDQADSDHADNADLLEIYKADQSDRTAGTAPSDWEKVVQNDAARQARVRQLLDAGMVKSGRDHFHAAMVFQHAEDAEGIELAHELAMIGACIGDRNSRWLAAASYDRFLMYLKRPQRFGTQYRSDEQGVLKLYEVADGVTDSMRAALRVPPISEARAKEKVMQEQMDELRKSMESGVGGK